MLIHDLVFATAEEYGDATAFWIRSGDELNPMSYSQLADNIKTLAAGITKLGLKPGDRIGLYATNKPEWAITYMAILAAGGVVVPLDPNLKLLELRGIIARANMKYMFSDWVNFDDLQELQTMADPYPDMILVDRLDIGPPKEREGLSLTKLYKLGLESEYEAPERKPDDLALLIFTSGTMGDSKGVMLSHENIVADIEAVRRRLDIGPNDRFLSVLPLFHTFEATCGMIYPLAQGASILYARTLKSAALMEDIKRIRATLMCGVPLLYEKMYAGIKRALEGKPKAAQFYVNLGQKFSDVSKSLFNKAAGKIIFRSLRKKAGLDSIRLLISGGAAIDPQISRFFNNLGITLLQGYGLSETSPVLSVNSLHDNNYASVGEPLPGVDVKILKPNQQGVGEIAVKGKMIMMGYYENPEATSAVMKDGFFATGDLGYLDDKGHIHITGRKKNVIVSPAGKNIYPEEIEAVIDSSSLVLECAVVPRKKKTGQEPIAVVVPDFEFLKERFPEEKLSDEELRQLMRLEVSEICEQLSDYKRVKDVIVLTEELPKTSTRKIKRHALIDSLQQLGEL